MEFSERFIWWCDRNRLSTQDVADMLGVTVNAVLKWKRGEGKPRDASLKLFYSILDITESMFYAELPRPKEDGGGAA